MITLVRAVAPAAVNKRYGPERKPDGRLQGHAVACISEGVGCSYGVADAPSMVKVLRYVTESDDVCLVAGAWLGSTTGQPFHVVTGDELKKMRPKGDTGAFHTGKDGAVYTARLKEHIAPSAWLLLDFDNPPGIPEKWAALGIAERLAMIEPLIPGCATCERIELRSGSSRLLNGAGPGPYSHAWVRVSDPAQVELLREHVKVQMVLQDLSYPSPRHSKATGKEIGQEQRTLLDLAVWITGRLVFTARPSLAPGVEGYAVGEADIRIVNQGAGVLDLDWVTLPETAALAEYEARTGVKLEYSRRSASLLCQSSGELTWDTPIEHRGKVDTLRNWTAGKPAGWHLRCEAPFRASTSEAAFIRIAPDGTPFVFDIGTGTKHTLGSAALREVLQAVRAARADAPPPHQDGAGEANESAAGGGEPEGGERIQERAPAPAVAFVAARLDSFMPATAADPLVNESALPFLDRGVIETAARTSTYASKAGRVITHTGDKLIEFGADEWSRLVPDFIGDVICNRREYSSKVLETVAQRKAKGASQAELTTLKTRAQVAPGKALADYLKLHAQCQTAAFTVDMFATRASVRLDGIRAQFTLPFQPLDERGAREDVGADFTEHFPELPGFLRLLLMARFAADRRRAFVWLHAPTDWGKALLTSALQHIGILFELTVPLIEKALRGDAVGFDPVRAMYGWVMFVDEFNKASSELKQLNRSISMSAKWQMQTEVDLYVKLFASKEPVRSLIGNGAEEQFNERFSLLSGEGRIVDRPLMRRIGGGAYVRGLAGYIARVINAGVAEMRALGHDAAELAAQRWLDNFQARHRLSATHGELADTLRDVADSITEILTSFGQRGAQSMLASAPARLDLFLRDNAKVRYTKRHGAVLRIRRLAEFVTLYIEASASRQSAAQLSYRAAEIAGIVDQRKRKRMGRLRLFPTPDCSGEGDQEKGALLCVPSRARGVFEFGNGP